LEGMHGEEHLCNVVKEEEFGGWGHRLIDSIQVGPKLLSIPVGGDFSSMGPNVIDLLTMLSDATLPIAIAFSGQVRRPLIRSC
jgi:hypothetical protein